MMQLWNEWAIQILVLLSFALQMFLFVFARTRRHGSSNVLRILIWLAYLMADSTAVYTLGHLSINGSPHELKLAVFWAPFLLVHLGSQDTITAYALEDNQLWARHLLNLGIQAFGVAYVLYKHIAELPTQLGVATGLMFFIGIIKYGERIWALKCATLQSILNSLRKGQPLPACYSAVPSRGAREGVRDEEELLLFAHAILPLCKGAMSNYHVALFTSLYLFPIKGKLRPSDYRWNWNWKAICKVVEMELSLMYDILYTKAAVIHTWYGYLFRLVSPLATASVFLLYQLSGNKIGYSRIDVAITYILLVGAFFLDMASMFSALGSTWTCNYLWTRDWRRFSLIIMSLRRHVKAAGGNRRWSGSIGQFNLLHFCSRDSTKLSSRVAKMMLLEDWWNKKKYSETLVISEDIKELVLKRVWQALKKIQHPYTTKDEFQFTPYEKDMEEPIAEMPNWTHQFFGPGSFEDIAKRRGKLVKALDFSDDLQHMILVWHVATDVFLLCSTPINDAAASSTCVKAIKALSDYMLFLVAICPDMIPGIEIRSLYNEICDDVENMWLYSGESSFDHRSGSREKKLARILQNSQRFPRQESGSALLLGVSHARVLLELVNEDNPDYSRAISHHQERYGDNLNRLMPDLESSCRGGVFDMPKALALILDAWVRLLIFASVGSSGEANARQISRGGELTTVVWLIVEHAGMFLKLPESPDRH